MDTQKLDALLEASPFAWWEWRIPHNRVIFNDIKATMLGYDPADFTGAGYEAFTTLIHPNDYEKSMDAMRAVLTGKSDLYQIDYRIQAAGGAYHWYMDRGFVLERDEQGKPEIIRGIVIDLGRESRFSGSAESIISIIMQSLPQEKGSDPSFLTICSNCTRVKYADNAYTTLSPDLFKLLGEKVSHGICSDCIRALYPEFAAQILTGRV